MDFWLVFGANLQRGCKDWKELWKYNRRRIFIENSNFKVKTLQKRTKLICFQKTITEATNFQFTSGHQINYRKTNPLFWFPNCKIEREKNFYPTNSSKMVIRVTGEVSFFNKTSKVLRKSFIVRKRNNFLNWKFFCMCVPNWDNVII